MIKAVAKTLLGRFSWVQPGSRIIFVYHDISDASDEHHDLVYSTTPQEFCEQVQFLQKKFQFLALEELLEYQGRIPAASLTFDDGFASVASTAMPLLEKEGIPFTVFCNRDAIASDTLTASGGPQRKENGSRRYLSPPQVQELARRGVTIGSHGATHRALVGLSPQELHGEIHENALYLRSLIQKPILHFAFPFGKPQHFDRAAVNSCLAAGHRLLYSASPGFLSPGVKIENQSIIPRASLHRQKNSELNLLLHRLHWDRLKRGFHGEA